MKICRSIVSRTAQVGEWLRVSSGSLVQGFRIVIAADIARGQTIEVVEGEEIIEPE